MMNPPALADVVDKENDLRGHSNPPNGGPLNLGLGFQ